MRVFYDPMTLVHYHVITHMDWTRDDLHDAIEHWFDVDHQHPQVPHEHLQVTRDANGLIGARDKRTGKDLPILRRLQRFSITGVTLAKVGDTVGLKGIPDGTKIIFKGNVAGIMDDGSGVLELVPREPGPHLIQFRHDNFRDFDMTIQVVA